MPFKVLRRFSHGDEPDPHGDRATLGELAKAGADLAKETDFRHQLYFAEPEAAREAGRFLAEEVGYGVKGFAPAEDGGDWLVVAQRQAVPSLENVLRMRQFMELVASNHGGDYDGWEAAVET